jgi:hypothetical protein
MRSRHGNRARRGLLLLAALSALALLAVPSLAAAKDRNNDRIPDRWEKRHHLSLKVNQAPRDQDRDRLSNRGEFKAGMDPRDRDSDNDGVKDGVENAGTIASFDAGTGKLVVNLYGGDTISGFVTDETRIKCGHGCRDHGDDGNSEASASNHGEDESEDEGEDEDHAGPGDGEMPPPGHDGTPPGSSEDPGDGAENSADCTTDALVEGAVVEEAELKLRDGKAVYKEVELEEQAKAAGADE